MVYLLVVPRDAGARLQPHPRRQLQFVERERRGVAVGSPTTQLFPGLVVDSTTTTRIGFIGRPFVVLSRPTLGWPGARTRSIDTSTGVNPNLNRLGS